MKETFNKHAFLSTFIFLGLGNIWILLHNEYLPMVDLPPFAQQLWTFIHLNKIPNLHALYQVNWFSPYLMSTLIGLFLSFFVPLFLATKVIVVLACLSIPLSLLWLLKKIGADARYSLVGFILNTGFSFYYGFLNFLLGTSLLLLFLGVLYDLRQLETRKKWILAVLIQVALLLTHLMLWGVSVVLAVIIFLSTVSGNKKHLIYLLSVIVGFAACAFWFVTKNPVTPFIQWKINQLRLLNFPSELASFPGDSIGSFIGVVLLLILVLGSEKPRLNLERGALLICSLILCFVGPRGIGWNYYIDQRFASFVIFGWLCTQTRQTQKAGKKYPVVLLTLLSLGSLAYHNHYWNRFNNENLKGFKNGIEAIPSGKTAQGLIFSPTDDRGWDSLIHFPFWYQSTKGGSMPNTFSIYPNWIIQDRHFDREFLKHLKVFEQYPDVFDCQKDFFTEYLITRGSPDEMDKALSTCGGQVELVSSENNWWVYRNTKFTSSGFKF